MKRIIQIIIILLTFSSCSYYAQPPKVKVRYEYEYSFKNKLLKDWETSKWRKHKTKREYIKYDENRNEIEIGEFGEIWHFEEINTKSDSSIIIISGHGRYPRNLNTVTFKSYNDRNQLSSEEVWRFKDNKKHDLVYKTVFKYKNNQLYKETDLDANGQIIRKKEYDLNNNVQKDFRKKAIFEPFVRIDGNSIDSITYDTLGREIEKLHYYDGKFLRRTVTIFNDSEDLKSVYLYDDKPDSLWSYTEYRYDYISDQLLRKYWKVLNTRTETKEVYKYNRKKLLKKILIYGVDLQTGEDELKHYVKYKYKF